MKVIEQKEWFLERECPLCHSRLHIESDDIKVGYFGGNAWEPGQKGFYWKCPSCQSDSQEDQSSLSEKAVTSAELKYRELFQKP